MAVLFKAMEVIHTCISDKNTCLHIYVGEMYAYLTTWRTWPDEGVMECSRYYLSGSGLFMAYTTPVTGKSMGLNIKGKM